MKKKFGYMLFVLMLVIVLSGCTKQYYSDDFEKMVVSQGKEVLTTYLSNNYNEYKIVSNVEMVNGKGSYGNPGDDFGSTIVKASVEIDGKECQFYVDTDTNIIYSDYHMDYVEQFFLDQFKSDVSGMDIDFYYDFNVSSYQSLASYSDNTKSKENQGIYDVEVSLQNVFDVAMTGEDIVDYMLENEEASIVAVCYYNVEQEKEIDCNCIFECMKANTMFQSVKLYSVAAPYFEIIQSEQVVPYSYMIGVDEYYEFGAIDGLNCRHYTTTVAQWDNVAVRYVSNITFFNDELQVLEDTDYESPAHFDGNELTIERSKVKTFLYFTGEPGYSRIKVERYRADGTKNKPDDVIIVKLVDGIYSLSTHGDMGYKNTGYQITQDTLITFRE